MVKSTRCNLVSKTKVWPLIKNGLEMKEQFWKFQQRMNRNNSYWKANREIKIVFIEQLFLIVCILLWMFLTCFYSICVESTLSLLYNPLFLDNLPDHWFDLIDSTDVLIDCSWTNHDIKNKQNQKQISLAWWGWWWISSHIPLAWISITICLETFMKILDIELKIQEIVSKYFQSHSGVYALKNSRSRLFNKEGHHLLRNDPNFNILSFC